MYATSRGSSPSVRSVNGARRGTSAASVGVEEVEPERHVPQARAERPRGVFAPGLVPCGQRGEQVTVDDGLANVQVVTAVRIGDRGAVDGPVDGDPVRCRGAKAWRL